MRSARRGALGLVLLAYTEVIAAHGALRPPPEQPHQVARPAEIASPAIEPTDVVFPPETELSAVFGLIAQKGNFNVVVDPRVRQKVAITLRNVEPLEALEMVARLNGLRLHRITGKRGVTYVVTIPELIEECMSVEYTRVVQLEGLRARAVADQLARGIGRDENFSVEIDERTNKLIMRGTEETLARAVEFIARYTRRR